MRFSDYLKGYKIDYNLTISEMCEITGVSYSAMCKHFYGGNIPQPAIFAKYAILFGNNDGEFLKKKRDYFWDEERAYRMRKADGEDE